MNISALHAQDIAAELGLELANLHCLAETVADGRESAVPQERRGDIEKRIDALLGRIAESRREAGRDIEAAFTATANASSEIDRAVDAAFRGQ